MQKSGVGSVFTCEGADVLAEATVAVLSARDLDGLAIEALQDEFRARYCFDGIVFHNTYTVLKHQVAQSGETRMIDLGKSLKVAVKVANISLSQHDKISHVERRVAAEFRTLWRAFLSLSSLASSSSSSRPPSRSSLSSSFISSSSSSLSGTQTKTTTSSSISLSAPYFWHPNARSILRRFTDVIAINGKAAEGGAVKKKKKKKKKEKKKEKEEKEGKKGKERRRENANVRDLQTSFSALKF